MIPSTCLESPGAVEHREEKDEEDQQMHKCTHTHARAHTHLCCLVLHRESLGTLTHLPTLHMYLHQLGMHPILTQLAPKHTDKHAQCNQHHQTPMAHKGATVQSKWEQKQKHGNDHK